MLYGTTNQVISAMYGDIARLHAAIEYARRNLDPAALGPWLIRYGDFFLELANLARERNLIEMERDCTFQGNQLVIQGTFLINSQRDNIRGPPQRVDGNA